MVVVALGKNLLFKSVLAHCDILTFFSAEHLKDWRPRYFILKDNGEFIGYKKEPSTEANLNNILNNFTGKLNFF